MADSNWLEDLRSNVEGAVAEIAKLRRQNKSLKTQLTKAKKAAAKAEKAAPDPEAEQWRTERKEVRRAEQWLNLPHGAAKVNVVLDTHVPGRERLAHLSWETTTGGEDYSLFSAPVSSD